MTNRLPYETKGGELSEAETFSQLIEYLRMAEECCYTLGHWYKSQDDLLKGQGFLAVGQMLAQANRGVTTLATKSHRVLS